MCDTSTELNLFCLKAKDSKFHDFTPFIAADVMILRTLHFIQVLVRVT